MCLSNDRRWALVPNFEWGVAKSFVEVELWDTTSGKSRSLSKFEITLASFAFSPDGKRCVCGGSPGVRVWDTATGKLLWQATHCNALDPRFTADGRHIVTAPRWTTDRWHIWDAATGEEAKNLHPPTDYALWFEISPDGAQLLLSTETDYILWDMKAGRQLRRWPGANWWGRGAFAPDGRSVVTYDTILRRWDLATGKNLYADVSPLGHTGAVEQLFFSRNSKRLISIGADHTARRLEHPFHQTDSHHTTRAVKSGCLGHQSGFPGSYRCR